MQSTPGHCRQVVRYRRLAEVAGEYLRKGAAVYIEGRLHTRKWQDKDDHERYSPEIEATEMQMLGGRHESQPGSQEPPPAAVPTSAKRISAPPLPDDWDIPPF